MGIDENESDILWRLLGKLLVVVEKLAGRLQTLEHVVTKGAGMPYKSDAQRRKVRKENKSIY